MNAANYIIAVLLGAVLLALVGRPLVVSRVTGQQLALLLLALVAVYLIYAASTGRRL